MSLQDDVDRIRRTLTQQEATKVRVALFGQPGAGKSSLINAITGRELAKVGVATDTTTEAASYEWNGLTLTDLPGYDTVRFPAAWYVERFGIRNYDLFLCVLTMRMHAADTQLFRQLHELGKECVFISNKCDQLWQPPKTREELQKEIEADVRTHTRIASLPVYFTSCRDVEGLAEVQAAIASKLEPAKRKRWAEAAKAYSERALEEKREACVSTVRWSAAIAAMNTLNPIPGVDIAVDVGLLLATFAKIRKSYGLTDARLETGAELVPAIGPLVNQIVEWSTKEGLMILLKQFLKRTTVKQIAKYIPFVGQAIAATIGYGITSQAGDAYLSTCHEVAVKLYERELKRPDVGRGTP